MMASAHEQEPKPKKKSNKPRQSRTAASSNRKKPAGGKKAAKAAAPHVEAPPEPTVETQAVIEAPPPEPAVVSAQEAAAVSPPREAPRAEGPRVDKGRWEAEDDFDFHAGLWGEEPSPEPAPVMEATPPAPVERGEPERVHEPELPPPPEEERGAIETTSVEDRPVAPLSGTAGREFEPRPGGEPPPNGETRRRRRRGRRGRGRGRGQDGNGQHNGQPGGAGSGGVSVVDRPQRDQGQNRDQGQRRDHGHPREQGHPRDHHDQHGRRDQQRPQPDHRGPREQHERREQHGKVEHRDHRGLREHGHPRDDHGLRDQRGVPAGHDRGAPVAPPPVEPQPAALAEGEEASAIRGDGERTMLINVAEGEECRIAILHQGRLEELFMERASTGSHVGNIYKGRVTNVEPSIQAAFIDFGLPKNGFLHISDLQPQYFPDGMRQTEEVGRKTPRRERPPIQRCLRRGQEVLVQIIKEGIGTKGPTLTTYISIPGRFLVMLPGMNRVGVSRKIEDEELRRKMRRILDELELPRDMGFILRTAGIDCAKRELQRDLQYLQRLWKVVANRIKNERAPCELYQESDLVIRTVRDVFSTGFGKIIVDDEGTAEKIRDFLSIVVPRGVAPVEAYQGPEPLFHKYHIEEEIERINARYVPLPLGGSLVIDSTEAMVAIDVNSGRYRDLEDAEETAYRINIEAAEEIARQLRLRDLGGLIVCDFIDMRMEKHRRAVERSLREALKKHKERAKCLRMSQFGLIEMTRQRMRPSIKRSIYQDCPHCRGTGLVKNAESMTLDIMRLLRLMAFREGVQTVEVRVATSVAHQLLNRKRGALVALEQSAGRRIIIRSDGNLGLDQYHFECLDARGGLIETLDPPADVKPGSELRTKRSAPPNEGRESFEDVFD